MAGPDSAEQTTGQRRYGPKVVPFESLASDFFGKGIAVADFDKPNNFL
jgi:hypothetical protein